MSDLSNVQSALDADGMILLPTETVYGLAARANSKAGIDKIYAAKGRDFNKPLAVFVRDIEQAQTLGIFDRLSLTIAERYWPGSVTIIVPTVTGGGLDPRVMSETDMGTTIALRCPDVDWRDQIESVLALTSANHSGQADCTEYNAAMKLFGNQIDASFSTDTLLSGVPSTIVRTVGGVMEILRQGNVVIDGVAT